MSKESVKVFCGDCIYYQAPTKLETGGCSLSHIRTNPKDYCSFGTHGENGLTCDYCGSTIISSVPATVEVINGKVHVMCGNCLHLMHTCTACENMKTCDFESNSSPLPKIIPSQIKQGQMTIMTQIKNPERIKITCENGCHCWKDNECQRGYNYCKQYEQINIS